MNEQEFIAYLQQSVRTMLETIQIRFRESDGDFVFGMNGEQDRYMVIIKCNLSGIRFYCSKIDNIPQNHISRVAEYITRVNYQLQYGGFELNYATGDLRYKTTVSLFREDFEEGINLLNTIRGMLILSIEMMERYILGINRMLQDDTITPESALSSV